MLRCIPNRMYAAWALVLLAGIMVTRFWMRDAWYFHMWIIVWAAVAFACETWTFWRWWRGRR